MKKLLITFASAILLLQWISLSANYSQEYQDAYNYAYNQWITTVSPIEKANIYGSLTRIAMAKMISNFAINVLWIIPDNSLDCSFIDVSDELDAWYGYWVKKACQLWLMWIWSNGKLSNYFNPNWAVTRRQWATVFSRALSKYNWDTVIEETPYYKAHLEYLHSKWIIKDVENPTAKSVEKRWNVMLMMYRVSQNVKNYEESDLVWWFENIDESKNNTISESEDLEDSEPKEIVYHRVNNSYSQFMIDDFNAVEDVYKNIKSWDRVIFLVRHSERKNDCTVEWWLSEYWVELANWVWLKLQWAPFEDTSTDFYGSSYTKRTAQTSYYVGKSRDSKVLKNPIDLDKWSEYEFINHSGDIDEIVYWHYFSNDSWFPVIENFYEENIDVVEEKSLKMITRLCKLTEWHHFSRITSHDLVTLPITEWATNGAISFLESDSERSNYMQWVAIIVHKDWGWEIYPVKSLESWKMKTRENPGC